MLKASTLKFLESIKKNNNRDWFEKNKNAYVEALDNFHEFLQAVIDGGKKFDSNLMELNAKKATMRIYRDVRFSKDKAPYKSIQPLPE